MTKSFFGIVGLGVMGSNLALNVLDRGHSLSVYNRGGEGEAHLLPTFMESVGSAHKVSGFDDLKEFIASLERPKKVLLMIKAGPAVDAVIQSLMLLLEEGDIIIDGGNSLYTDTVRREEYCKNKGVHFVGMGVSGGAEGARRGPSIMVGGSTQSYESIGALLESIAAKDKFKGSCCAHVGIGGAGHFVKMIHNGIEYAEMQLIAEVYDLLKMEYTYEEIADILEEWQGGELSSFLLGCSVDILRHRTGDSFTLDLILDKAGNKGTGGWSSKAALDLGIAAPMMSAAVFARYQSSLKSERISLAQQVTQFANSDSLSLSDLKEAYKASRIINHHQGFAVIKAASDTYDWNINLSELARIWTNGCILRSELTADLVELFKTNDSILATGSYVDEVDSTVDQLVEVISHGMNNRIPLPCFQAAQSSWYSATTERLPANMIQAQRDYFGSHTYRRVDKAESEVYHTEWKK